MLVELIIGFAVGAVIVSLMGNAKPAEINVPSMFFGDWLVIVVLIVSFIVALITKG